MIKTIFFLAGLALWLPQTLSATDQVAPKKSLKALLVCGGCCHDYEKQSIALRDGIQARANVQVDIVRSEDRSTKPQFEMYQDRNWANGYDIIIHDECAADVNDPAIIANVMEVHRKVPAVNLHCAMHSFRNAERTWAKFIGLHSSSHGPQEPIRIEFIATEHPITQTLSNWTTEKEELYNNVDIHDAKPLAMGTQTLPQKDGSHKQAQAIVAWTNEAFGARSFSTTIGHNNTTVEDSRYLDLITRGLLWACDQLNPQYLQPYQGANGKVTILAKP